MNAADFQSLEAGRVMLAAGGYAAFVPSPLPPKVLYSDQLANALSMADAALGELAGVGRLVPNPRLLIAPYVRREAVLSSRIEGTRTSLAELLADEAGQPAPDAPDDVREVRNYVEALEYGVKRLKTLPLSLRLTCELHGRLMRGARGGHATPGEFRRSQNWIGPPGSTPATATYVPPPVEEMKHALGEWEKFLHVRETMPDLVQCALMHEHFEAIHPFLDGNGRVGRLLITLFLIERERMSLPLLYLSEFIERYRREYYDGLLAVRTRGDWHGWLVYFLNGVRWSARRAIRQAGDLIALHQKLLKQLSMVPRALPIVDALFENPYLSPARAAKLAGVSDPTARKLIGRLQAAKVLREHTGKKWGKQYVAPAVLKAIEQPAEEGEDSDA